MMVNRDDDLIFFAQKVKKAKSPLARQRALKQLEVVIQAAKIANESEIKKSRENR
jgi:hypothetical protein